MDYSEWNNLIARKFFNEDMAGREVLLYVNEAIINELGSEADVDIENFILCIKNGPTGIREPEVCSKAWRLYVSWKQSRELEYPPYIAYLAFFSLAATVEGDFVPWAYYPRFWKLLGETDKEGAPPDFYNMGILWEDLEKWSTEDKNEDFGRFVARIRGGYAHVGRPLSQTLLSDKERKYLPLIFDKADFDPTNLPSDAELRRKILLFGENKLEKRTLQLLKNPYDNIELVDALIDFVIGELVEWDGTVLAIEESSDSTPTRRTGQSTPRTGMRICIEDPDRLSGRISATLRLKTNRSFPDSGLSFAYNGQELTCKETNPPYWSTKLMNASVEPQQPFNASTLDWNIGAKFEDINNKWRASLKGALVRLFLPGVREYLPGWIEAQHLERKCNFIIACHSSKAEVVHQWGVNYCDNFMRIPAHGLPEGWSLFEGFGAREPCDGFDVLTLPDHFRFILQGGIKTGRGNAYFKFGPPVIVLEGADGSELVTLNGGELKRKNTLVPRWLLPPDAPTDTPLIIEVYKLGDQNPSRRRTIILKEPEIHLTPDDAPKRNSLGEITNNVSVPYCRGAIVFGTDSATACNDFQKVLPTYLSKRIVFLGSKPGEIADWPKEQLPQGWSPVWALAKFGRDRWIVNFCGEPDQELNPDPNFALADIRAVKRWKEAIWVMRKRIKTGPLLLPVIRNLWERYKEVAKNVV